MRTLNLVDLDKSDIKYLHQKFPDGQQNIVINPIKETTLDEIRAKLNGK